VEVLDAPGEGLRETHAGRVRPVGVVEDEDERRLVGEVAREPEEAVQACVGDVLGAAGVGHGVEHGLRQRSGAGEEPPAAGTVGTLDLAFEQLAHDAVGEVALELGAHGAEDADAGG
jgi:hypothetical protein